MRIRLAAAAALSVLVGALPAHATGVPPMRVTVTGQGTSILRVCANGSADASVRSWALSVAGARDNGSVINARRDGTGTTFSACIDVPKVTTAGRFVAVFSYVGAGEDVAGAFPAYGVWSPSHSDIAGGSGITL